MHPEERNGTKGILLFCSASGRASIAPRAHPSVIVKMDPLTPHTAPIPIINLMSPHPRTSLGVVIRLIFCPFSSVSGMDFPFSRRVATRFPSGEKNSAFPLPSWKRSSARRVSSPIRIDLVAVRNSSSSGGSNSVTFFPKTSLPPRAIAVRIADALTAPRRIFRGFEVFRGSCVHWIVDNVMSREAPPKVIVLGMI